MSNNGVVRYLAPCGSSEAHARRWDKKEELWKHC